MIVWPRFLPTTSTGNEGSGQEKTRETPPKDPWTDVRRNPEVAAGEQQTDSQNPYCESAGEYQLCDLIGKMLTHEGATIEDAPANVDTPEDKQTGRRNAPFRDQGLPI